jgi:translation initiation factor 2 beta subunit (eIF-2beta)/eIF-5
VVLDNPFGDAAGLSTLSRSNVTAHVTCMPPPASSTATGEKRARTREPAGTGEMKRTIEAVIDDHPEAVERQRAPREHAGERKRQERDPAVVQFVVKRRIFEERNEHAAGDLANGPAALLYPALCVGEHLDGARLLRDGEVDQAEFVQAPVMKVP